MDHYRMNSPTAKAINENNLEEAKRATMQLRALLQDSKVSRDIKIEELMKRNKKLRSALEGLLIEWDQLSRYGSPIAKVRVAEAQKILKETLD